MCCLQPMIVVHWSPWGGGASKARTSLWACRALLGLRVALPTGCIRYLVPGRRQRQEILYDQQRCCRREPASTHRSIIYRSLVSPHHTILRVYVRTRFNRRTIHWTDTRIYLIQQQYRYLIRVRHTARKIRATFEAEIGRMS